MESPLGRGPVAAPVPSCFDEEVKKVSIIRSTHAILFASMLFAAPAFVAAASTPAAHPANDTPLSPSKAASALPAPTGAAAPASGHGPVLALAETSQDGGTVEEGTLL